MELSERYTEKEINELELLYPGPYFIYKVENYPNKHGVHIGCTRNPKSRFKTHSSKSPSLPKVLFETTSLLQAAEKEQEVKRDTGIHHSVDYIQDLKRQIRCRSKKARRKAVANTDFKARTLNTDYKAKVANTDYKARTAKINYKAFQERRIAKIDFKARTLNTDFKARTLNTDYAARTAKVDSKANASHRQRGVVSISSEGIRTEYSGMHEAARQLTIKTGIKFNQGGISNVCNPKYPTLLTHRGYKFEYTK